MLSTLIDSHVPPAERSVSRLVDEGTAILLAGTETTARALSIAMFYLLDQKECLTKLRQELIALPAHEINWFPLSLLEPLPYLVSINLHSFQKAIDMRYRMGWSMRLCASRSGLSVPYQGSRQNNIYNTGSTSFQQA